ncbi:hypothetical protein [Actinosynnema sp. NPDC023587]|uniref:hypothetical protein n=1 Tax=Actinosynnema sp. NPDC023587 TaxID=3154695 RepID=UPI0033F9FE31
MERLNVRPEDLRWLADDPDGYITGYDKSGWDASTWVLHAMWEQPSFGPVTYDELRRQQVADGTVEREAFGGIDLDDGRFVATGVPLGYVEAPGEGWRRLRWRALADRLGFGLGVDQPVPPCFRWFPMNSWPVDILPPSEGSLDGTSLRALLQVLSQHSPAGDETQCFAFYGSSPTGDYDNPTVYSGSIGAVAAFSASEDVTGSPSNFWPDDRSWFVYTDWDCMATKVSGSHDLVEAMRAAADLETFPIKAELTPAGHDRTR